MLRKIISLIIAIAFTCSCFGPVCPAQTQSLLGLSKPGVMVSLSPSYEPALIKGLNVHKENPFLFDFIVDTGNSKLSGDALRSEGDRLIKYFFAALTIPDKDLWVNLSPYEKDRMIPQALGKTAMGRDLLAQDYMLKQLTASLIYPEKGLGKEFWDKIYAQARERFGTTDIPVNTFNKVWIVAQKASVYEHNQTAFIVSGHLKVMLEEDYLATQKHQRQSGDMKASQGKNLTQNVIRQIIIPAIEHEVNTGKNFATLRQIFYSQILATWFKRNLKQTLLSQVYADRSTVKGIDLKDPLIKELIYQRYLQAYKKGAFNYIKEEFDPLTQESTPKKYFSGGYATALVVDVVDRASTSQLRVAEKPTGRDVDLTAAFHLNPVKKDLPIEILFMELNSSGEYPWLEVDAKRSLKVYLSNPVDPRRDAKTWMKREIDFWLLIPKAQRPLPKSRAEILENIQARYQEIVGATVIQTLHEYGNLSVGGKGLEDTKAISVYLKDRDMGKAVATIRHSLGYSSAAEDAQIARILHRSVYLYNRYRVAATAEEISAATHKIADLIKRGVNDFTAAPLETDALAIVLDSLGLEGWFVWETSQQSPHGIAVTAPGKKNPPSIDKFSVFPWNRDDLLQRLESIEMQGLDRSTAMRNPQRHADRAQATVDNGGIDLNTLNNGLTVTKDADGGVSMPVDAALMAQVRREGISTATPVIINMRVLSSVDQLLDV